MVEGKLTARFYSRTGSFSAIAAEAAKVYSPDAIKKLLDETLPARMGQLATSLLRKHIRSGNVAEAPLGPLTKAAKTALGLGKPESFMVATGKLLRALDWKMVKAGAVEVGFLGAYAGGLEKGQLAQMLEQARLITVTTQMRKFFIAQYLEHNKNFGPHRAGSTAEARESLVWFLHYKVGDKIPVPARPWWQNAMAKIRPELEAMLEDEIPKVLQAYFEGFRHRTSGGAANVAEATRALLERILSSEGWVT